MGVNFDPIATQGIQGYFEKPPPRTLQLDYAWGLTVVLAGGAVSYERSTPLHTFQNTWWLCWVRSEVHSVASRFMRPVVGPYDLPGTSWGSTLTTSPLKGCRGISLMRKAPP